MELHEVKPENREDFLEAKKLYSAGFSFYLIGKRLGRNHTVIARWLCPKRRKRMQQYDVKFRRNWNKPKKEKLKLPPAGLKVDKSTKEAADRRVIKMLNEAGRDTRPLVGRMYGDPLPHRSAAHNWQPQKFEYTPPPLVPYEVERREFDGRKFGKG